jgi:hypothetical protein
MTAQTTTSHSGISSAFEWPIEGLERVKVCPVCASNNRREEFAGLEDRSFACAPGKWTLNRCLNCGCAYLDPRQTPHSTELAYRNYFTHGANRKQSRSELVTWIRQGLRLQMKSNLSAARRIVKGHSSRSEFNNMVAYKS